jgi:hypothetical protein
MHTPSVYNSALPRWLTLRMHTSARCCPGPRMGAMVASSQPIANCHSLARAGLAIPSLRSVPRAPRSSPTPSAPWSHRPRACPLRRRATTSSLTRPGTGQTQERTRPGSVRGTCRISSRSSTLCTCRQTQSRAITCWASAGTRRRQLKSGAAAATLRWPPRSAAVWPSERGWAQCASRLTKHFIVHAFVHVYRALKERTPRCSRCRLTPG